MIFLLNISTQQHQNIKILRPTPHNYEGITGDRDKNLKVLMQSSRDIAEKISISQSDFFLQHPLQKALAATKSQE